MAPNMNEEATVLETHILKYVLMNPTSTNTQLFSILALLKAYVPESYLRLDECQKILGPPDPIHGGPPFRERMRPFMKLIEQRPGGEVHFTNQEIAKKSVELLANLNISRSATVRDCMFFLCRNEAHPHTVQFMRDLLTRRETGKKKTKEKFSCLIKDIIEQERFYDALSLMRDASEKFIDKHIFPQTVSRLYYMGGSYPNYYKAEEWAKEAISRVPNNSYAADTLGQVYKNRLIRKAKQWESVMKSSQEAFEAFEDVEQKAEKELDPQYKDCEGTVNFSVSFNNRGLFGFIQVAKIVSEKLRHLPVFKDVKENRKMKVEETFEFFEWYLTYSKVDRTTLEPDYFWKGVVICYETYTEKRASDSTSFPGLLNCLNQNLFTSRERRAGFETPEITQVYLEQIREALKATYEEDKYDVKVAERYILSNIILSNKMPDPPEQNQVKELQTIICRFLETGTRSRSPEFYLLALMLFWPEKQLQLRQENTDKSEEQVREDDGLQEETQENVDTDEENTGNEPEQLSPVLMFDHLQQYTRLMKKSFEESQYAKYLRGRYLLPLFFLGKGSGLSKWIHASRLDAIVEKCVDVELGNVENSMKRTRISYMWDSGKVWQLPEVKNILQPIQEEPGNYFITTQSYEEEKEEEEEKEQEKEEEEKEHIITETPEFFYLGLNIEGPVSYKVETQYENVGP